MGIATKFKQIKVSHQKNMTILQWSPLYLVGIYICIFFISNVSGVPQSPVATAKSSQEAFEFVAKAESELHEAGKKATQIEWAYATNITDENERKKLENTSKKTWTSTIESQLKWKRSIAKQ